MLLFVKFVQIPNTMSRFTGRGSDYFMAGFSVFLVVMDPTAFLAKTSLPASDWLAILNLNPNQFRSLGPQ